MMNNVFSLIIKFIIQLPLIIYHQILNKESINNIK